MRQGESAAREPLLDGARSHQGGSESLRRSPPQWKKWVSMLPLLYILEVAFIVALTVWRAEDGVLNDAQAWSIYALAIVMSAYFLLASLLGYWGVYTRAKTQEAYIALWLPFVPVVIALVWFAASADLRVALARVVDGTADGTLRMGDQKWFIALQGLRVLALGSIIKERLGLFPFWFAYLTALPDFLFGLSAWILLAAFGPSDPTCATALAVWHLVGFVVIVPFSMIVLQSGLPGVFRIHSPKPGNELIYEFPMSLGPSIVVPIFVMYNLLCAWRLLVAQQA
ncbi:unnamed protein product [Ostreobium quekettii]|uniref:Uncharacterized protein n=1 Tax=Ostreobium quekettii TaxID=121088 RepID=A0A8S1ITX3_9CHLO|nr:unnamed protein product [Ostreobium quekettii]